MVRTKEETIAARAAAADEDDGMSAPELDPVNDTPAEPQEVEEKARTLAVTHHVDPTSIDRGDVTYPRIKLGQQMSQRVVDGEIPAGHWYLNIDGTDLGRVVKIVPLSMFKHRSLFVQGKGLLCRSYDLVQGVGVPGIACEGCDLAKWGPDSQPPSCRLNYNYLVMVVPEEDPFDPTTAIVTFQSTSVGAAKMLNAMKLQRAGQEGPWYTHRYILTSELKKGARGAYNVAKIQPADRIAARDASGGWAPVPGQEELYYLAQDMAGGLDSSALSRSIEKEDRDDD
jgi:hypothetical protein